MLSSSQFVRLLQPFKRSLRVWGKGYSVRAAATLEEKRERALKGGGEKRVEKQHKTVSYYNNHTLYNAHRLTLRTGEVDS